MIREVGSDPGASVAPPELAAYVNETFYAPLSSLLAKAELSAKMRSRLDAYRGARDDLRDELQRELTRLRGVAVPDRQRALGALARVQAPRLAALEHTAEELRRDLVDGYYGWFAQRGWQLGDRGSEADTPEEIVAVMRAYAFYKDGLLPAQRGLLREVAAELNETMILGGTTRPDVFFSPELARVRLPDGVPPPLAARIADYQAKKSALKQELYRAVYAQEKASVFQGNTLKARALDQCARLGELETLAEGIRQDLARLPQASPRAAASPLPPVLTHRVAEVLRTRAALQAAAEAQIERLNRPLQSPDASVTLSYAFTARGLVFDLAPARKNRTDPPRESARETERKIEALAAELKPVAEAFNRDFALTSAELNAIREASVEAGLATAQTSDALLSATLRHVFAQQHAESYRDYRTAVFEPGLSPEQRRLLFGSALRDLNLSLPPGESQPTARRR